MISREFDLFVSREGFQPRVILVRNHGLIAIGATPGAVLASTLMAAKAAEVFIGACSAGGPIFMTPSDVARIHSRLDEHYRQQQLKLE
jgi:ribulose-5-phosphate 4-epimerase/fuculose-1-phosphate aldolase